MENFLFWGKLPLVPPAGTCSGVVKQLYSHSFDLVNPISTVELFSWDTN